MARRGGRQYQQQRGIGATEFARWRQSLTEDEKGFLDSLAAADLETLEQIRDDATRRAIVDELMQKTEQRAEMDARLREELLHWYADDLTDEERAFCDGLSTAETTQFAAISD